MVLSITFDSFLITAMLLDDDTAVLLYNEASVVPSTCRFLTDDTDPSAGVVCPASVHKHTIFS